MKKGINKKILILPLFILTILAINLVTVSAANTFEESAFFEFIEPYFVPTGMEGIGGLIVGFISLVILFVIFLDIFSLIPIFSRVTTRYISVGLAIIMVVFKLNVTAAGWLFGVGAAVFGFTGTLAVIITIIFAILLLIGLFIGGSFLEGLVVKLQGIKANRKTLEAIETGSEVGANIMTASEAGRALRKHRK